MKNLLLFLLLAAGLTTHVPAADKKILLLAGSPSHGPGEHEYRAGCLLFQKCLATVPGVKTVVISNDWPADPKVFEDADAVFLFCTGGRAHPAIRPERLALLGTLMKKGVGFGTCHYGVEVPADQGGKEFLQWQGGYFETHWSVNPTWEADFKAIPAHPITRGVKPFAIHDEWYYHMRFVEGMKGVTPILSAVPPASTLDRPDGPHSGNPHVRAAVARGEPQHVAWAYEGPDGGRGFGFTGAHYHRNWGNENFRKIVLNALLWLAKVEVPPNGVECSLTEEDLQKNLDPKGRPRATVPAPPAVEPFVSPTTGAKQ